MKNGLSGWRTESNSSLAVAQAPRSRLSLTQPARNSRALARTHTHTDIQQVCVCVCAALAASHAPGCVRPHKGGRSGWSRALHTVGRLAGPLARRMRAAAAPLAVAHSLASRFSAREAAVVAGRGNTAGELAHIT